MTNLVPGTTSDAKAQAVADADGIATRERATEPPRPYTPGKWDGSPSHLVDDPSIPTTDDHRPPSRHYRMIWGNTGNWGAGRAGKLGYRKGTRCHRMIHLGPAAATAAIAVSVYGVVHDPM
ncbi:hypothetical protein F5B18DRAFT_649360 [Nemania serpens]|nr:hypothetical protein F5B18DRAFT_649360 [Nemania serpens]